MSSHDRPSLDGIRTRFTFALLILAAVVLPGCATMYVDNGLKDVSATEYKKPTTPQPAQLLFAFQTKGVANARGTEFLKKQVTETVAASGLFSSVSTDPAPGGALLSVVINNVPITDNALFQRLCHRTHLWSRRQRSHRRLRLHGRIRRSYQRQQDYEVHPSCNSHDHGRKRRAGERNESQEPGRSRDDDGSPDRRKRPRGSRHGPAVRPMKSLKLVLLLLAIASVGSSLVGCMSTSLVAHQPGLDSVNALRDSGIANVALGEFKVAPGVKTTTSVSARGSAFNAGAAKSATFADYLRSSMETDLRAAGKLDTASPLVIGSVITQNSLNAGGASSANSTLAARFTVTKGSQTLLDKETEDRAQVGVVVRGRDRASHRAQ